MAPSEFASPPTGADGVDVIVPVRGAGAVFRRCAASLAAHDDPARHALIVVLDGPADADTLLALDDLRTHGVEPTLLTHETPRGFVASVNLGMAHSTRDVVLLNSDTQVTAGWISRLRAAAYADERTATATPFSNNATICSLPQFAVENSLPAGWTTDQFGALVERVSVREYPRLPTGVGVCLFIKRTVLHEIGTFSDAYGVGYGEEVDFCLRASGRGYHHVLDDATFVFHEGSRTFGTSRHRRIRRAHQLIARRYPHYQRLVHAFIQADPLCGARARVTAALTPSRRSAARSTLPRVLHVVHGWPPWAHGGTELYARWLAHEQAQTRDTVVYARLADPDRAHGDAVEFLDHGVRVRLVANNFVERNPVVRAGLHSRVVARDFGRLLDEVRPDVVHVHHLAGHCATLLGVAARRRVSVVYQAQDWWPICARVNLLHANERLCDGPGPLACARCLPLTHLPPAPLVGAALHVARRRVIRIQLRHVDAVIAGSHFLARSYQEHRVLPRDVAVHVVPYGVPMPQPTRARERSPHAPLAFGIVGAMMAHKGVAIAVDAFTRLAPGAAALHIWGSSSDDAYVRRVTAKAEGRADVHLHGAFAESDKTTVLRALDVLLVPSVGLESYGLVAREALALGVPVIASRRGALAELFADGDGGTFVPAGDVDALAGAMQAVLNTPALVEQWRARIPPVPDTRAHARAVDAIYQSLKTPRP